MAKSKKVVLTTYTISSIQELDVALAIIAQKQATIQRESADYNKKEQQRRMELTAKITPLEEEIKDIEIALEQYCTQNRHEFPADKKMLELSHGKCMFRMSPPSVKTRKNYTLATVIELVKHHPNKAVYSQFIRMKEELNKEYILAESNNVENPITAKQLAEIGLEITQTESFRYELNLASEVNQNG